MVKGSVKVTVKRNDFPKLVAKMPNMTETVIMKTAGDILETATDLAPKRKGFLRGSGGIRQENRFRATIFWSIHYAIYQEFGTRYIAPRLFATKGAEAHEDAFVAAIKEMLQGLN